jgi:hypothetical protein
LLAVALAGDGAARALALGASCGVAGAAVLVLVGLPAGWLTLGTGAERPGPRASRRAVDALARLDAGLRARVLAPARAPSRLRRRVARRASARVRSRSRSLLAEEAPCATVWSGSRAGSAARWLVELDSGSDGVPERLPEHALALEVALASVPGGWPDRLALDSAVLPSCGTTTATRFRGRPPNRRPGRCRAPRARGPRG